MQERVDLSLPRATIPEQIGGQERWGPWRVNVEALKAILSLWTYDFKKAFDTGHKNGDFVFVIGATRTYGRIYLDWITRYSPDNPIFLKPNLAKYAGNVDDLQLVEYIGHEMPYSEPLIELKSKYGDKSWDDRRSATVEPWEVREDANEINEEYIGYRYKNHAKRYTDLTSLANTNGKNRANYAKRHIYKLAARVYAQHLFASFIATFAHEVEKVYGREITRQWDLEEETLPNAEPILNSVFATMAKFFVDSGLGSEEEAYLSIIPPLWDKTTSQVRSGMSKFILVFLAPDQSVDATGLVL